MDKASYIFEKLAATRMTKNIIQAIKGGDSTAQIAKKLKVNPTVVEDLAKKHTVGKKVVPRAIRMRKAQTARHHKNCKPNFVHSKEQADIAKIKATAAEKGRIRKLDAQAVMGQTPTASNPRINRVNELKKKNKPAASNTESIKNKVQAVAEQTKDKASNVWKKTKKVLGYGALVGGAGVAGAAYYATTPGTQYNRR